MLGEGHGIAEVAKALEITEQTCHCWRDMKADDAEELRKLRDENLRLERMVADQALGLEVLREVSRGNW